MKADIPSLTGLRFFAAGLVMAGHMLSYFFYDMPRVANLQHIAFFGMTLFFVLSGFVIHYNYGEQLAQRNGRWAFAVARFARLYPLYILFLVCDLWLNPGSMSQTDWMRYLTLTQSWTDHKLPRSVSTWSISTEIFLYIVYALAIPYLRKHLVHAERLVLWVGVIAIFVFVPQWIARTDDWWLWYVSPYARIPEFFLGCLMAEVRRPPSRRAIALMAAVGGLLLWISTSSKVFTDISRTAFTFAPLSAMLVLYLRELPNALRHFVPLGNASYSIYLFHGAFFSLFVRSHDWLEPFRLALLVALILVFCMGVYRFYERPARGAVRGWFSRDAQREQNAVRAGP